MAKMTLILRLLFLLLLPLLALCAEDLYKILGVDKDASDREMKRAYRALSKKYHPDKNVDDPDAHKKFVEVSEAYETLTDPELRKIYDTQGHEGLERRKDRRPGARGGGDPFDLFARFFGGGGHFAGGERKGPNVEAKIAVPLKHFYNGADTEFTVQKQVICDTCDGSGSADGKLETCRQCDGRGMVVQKMNLAPGIFQQMQSPCGACSGQGKVIRQPCKTCGGAKIVQAQETYEVHIEPGMPRGHRIIYENEANQSPEYVAGDMYVVLWEQQPSAVFEDGVHQDGTFFRRRGDSLIWREVLSLREAWMGDWTRNLTHLDGRILTLERERGQVVQPGFVEVLKDEGMPIWQEPDSHNEYQGDQVKYGNLEVEYVVVLPDQMESGMEKEFWALWDKWRQKKGVNLDQDAGRPDPASRSAASDDDSHTEL